MFRLSKNRKVKCNMKKTSYAMQEALRADKHPFTQLAFHSGKAKKHRYERRKIREFMRLGEWNDEDNT